jgi:hypothetical protein
MDEQNLYAEGNEGINDRPLYTEEDTVVQPSTNTGNYPTTKAIIAVATDNVDMPDEINHDLYVDENWRKTVSTRNDLDRSVAEQAASSGNVSLFQQSLESVAKRNEMYNRQAQQVYSDTKAKLKELTDEAVEKVSSRNVKVLINNTPQEIAEVGADASKRITALAVYEKAVEDGKRIGTWLPGFGYEFLPVAAEQGAAIDRAAIKMGVPPDAVGRLDGRRKTISYLQVAFESKTEEEKGEWLSELYEELQNGFYITDWQAALIIQDIVVGGEQSWGGWEDWLDRLGVVGAVATGSLALIKAGKLIKGAEEVKNLQRTIAAAGGKDVLVNAESAKILNAVATKQRLQAAGTVVGELTGVSAAIDLTKLVSLGATKVLPDAVLTAASDLTRPIRQSVDNLITEMQDVIAAKGIRSEEVAAQLDELKTRYSSANNPHIHSVDNFTLAADGTTITGKVYHKPVDSSAFLTPEAAAAYAKTLDPTGKLGVKVVPDTTNTAFLVEESVEKTLQLRKTALEAQLLERINEASKAAKTTRTRAAKTTTPKATVPKALKDGKPRASGGVPLKFDSDIDKAAYQVGSKTSPTKSDEVVKDWLQKTTGWTEEEINAHAAKVRGAVQANLGAVDETGTVTVARQTDIDEARATETGGEAPTGLYQESLTVAEKEEQFDALVTSKATTTVNNVSMSTNTQQRFIAEFTSTLGKALGMDNRKIMVLQWSDIQNSTDPNLQSLIKHFGARQKRVGAIHYPRGKDRSIIIMKSAVGEEGMTLKRYMEIFAHEYAHAFETQFTMRYSAIMNSNFKKWLATKKIKAKGEGINRELLQSIPFEALIEFRSVSDAEDIVGYVQRWFNGDVNAYRYYEADLRNWASDYGEFFAENFAKWAFSDAIPTDILGQAFKRLVDGFKLVVETLNAQLVKLGVAPTVGSVDKNTAAMLNEHIKLIKEGKIDVDSSISGAAKESRSIRPSAETLQKELEQVTDQLKAIEDAKKGLKHGWLVEQPLSKQIDYTVVGKYTDDDINSASRFAMGDWALSASSQLYADRVVGVNQMSRYQKLLTEFVRPSIERLSRKDRSLLNDALVLGDKEGKVFAEAELAGMGLSRKAKDAYYRVRALRDVMWQIRNDVASKSLIRRGYVQLDTGLPTDEGGSRIFAKPVEVQDGKYVYLSDTNTMQRMSAEFRENAVTQGYVFFEAVEPVLIDGKYRKIFAFKEGGYAQNKITEVIPYRAGEYRRIYSDEYFVKITSKVDMDGEIVEHTTTHRTAASMSDAKAYSTALTEAQKLHKAGKLDIVAASRLLEAFGWKPEDVIAAFETGRFGDDFKVDIKFNRMDEDYVQEAINLSSNYSSKRGDKVLSVYGEDTVNTLNPLDSIAAEIGNTAYVASVTEWRESHVIRWFNTFRDDLPEVVRGMTPEQAFVYMLNNEGLYVGTDKRLSTAQKIQEYIVSQLNIATKEEKEYLGFMRMLSESIEGKAGGGAIQKVGMALRASKDYPTWARTIAFHSFFAFNPVQLFMQGMNAFNAVAISPVHGMASARASSLYAIALFSDQQSIWENVAKVNKLTTLGLGMDTDEFVEVVRAIRRTGLLDGLNTTSLYGAEVGAYGIMNRPARLVGKASSGFFNAGEGLSRLVSFDIARREFKAANPGVAWWTDDALAKIIERQDDLTQNMTRANTASWQRGWKSIPTQFVQYQVKLMMNIIQSLLGNSRVFTRAEATQLLLVHTLVMGTAGNMIFPFRELIPELLPEDMSEEALLYVQQGIVAGMIGSLSEGEAKLGLGSRFNTFRYYEDLIKGLTDPEKTFMEVAGGPSGFAALRILGGVGQGISIISKAPMNMETLQMALTEIGKSSFSFLNNIDKYRIAKANYNRVVSSSGGAMYEVTDTEAFLLSFGIPPAAQEDLSILYSSKRSYNDAIKRDAKVVGKHSQLAMAALREGRIKDYEAHRAYTQAIINSHDGDGYRQLMREANKLDTFTQYQRLLAEQAIKDWTIKDVVTDTGVNQ